MFVALYTYFYISCGTPPPSPQQILGTLGARQHWARLETTTTTTTFNSNNNSILYYLCDGTTAPRPLPQDHKANTKINQQT